MSFFPDSIRVNAGELCPGVAMNDSIWVDHGNDLEDVVIQEGVLFFGSCQHQVQEIIDDSFDHKTRSSLNGMLSG